MEELRRRFTSPSPGGGAGAVGVVAASHHAGDAPKEPADYEDEEALESARWLDTEIVIGALVAILVVSAVVAVWMSYRRRRLRHESRGSAQQGSAPSVIHQLQTVNEKCLARTKSLSVLPLTKKLGQTSPTATLANGSANGSANGKGIVNPLTTIVLTGTPDVSRSPSGSPETPAVVGATGPWEPYFLGVGLPGNVTQARRRSVSLRSGDDEDGAISDVSRTPTPSRGPSPTLSTAHGHGDAPETDAGRKRSVTFNAMVEEVQFLRKQ